MGWQSKKRDESEQGVALASTECEARLRSQALPTFAGGGLPLSAQEIVGMQKLVGNQGVLDMLRSEPQSRSKGQPGDGVHDAASPHRPELGDVHLHTGPDSARAASALGVQAFTFGKDIFFGEGKFQPRSESGMRLLSHELAHVAQQNSSGTAATEDTLESEADHAESTRFGQPPVHLSSAGGVRVQGKDDHEKKGFWKTIGGAFAGAGEAIWGGIKAVGKGIATAAGAVWSGIKWLGTQLWDKLTGVLMRATDWVRRLPARIGRLLSDVIEGIATVRPWTAAWWKSLAHVSTWEHFLSWVGTVVLDLLEVGGIGELAETANELVKFNTRALSSHELAYSVFGGSIDLAMVRIDERAVIGPAFTKRAFTSFHTINAWGKLADYVLVHELTHVWQYENAGAIYMAQAVHAQISRGQGAYDYGGPAGLQAARAKAQGLTGFNREEQAQIVEDFYRIKHGIPPHVPGGTVSDLPLYAHFVKTVSTLTESQLLA
jgi:Domain of unknown function (DUF4157)